MSDQPNPRVLVVDDDPVIRRLLQVNFRLEGFDADAASNGEEAVEKIRAEPPDAVVLDVMMPGMDGWDVCRILREEERTASVPVIVLSARSGDDDRERAEQLGVADYVTKPFDPAALVEVVSRAVAGNRPAGS